MKPQRLIISRKGFDSASGGCPSPIFPDGTMYSLPVPGYDEERSQYATKTFITATSTSGGWWKTLLAVGIQRGIWLGLDPDIRPNAIARSGNWRGLFGQVGASQSHLANQRVDAGDVFLFFGLFRRVEKTSTGWRFVRGAAQQHILWGWLQIEQVCKVDEIRHDEKFEWATYHCQFRWYGDSNNTLYVATQNLNLNGTAISAPGAAVFPRVHERLVLTRKGQPASNWRLPRFFYPDRGKSPLTYHPDLGRWDYDRNHAYLRSAGRGQEFVLHCDQYPEAVDWLSGIVREFG